MKFTYMCRGSSEATQIGRLQQNQLPGASQSHASRGIPKTRKLDKYEEKTTSA